VRNERAEEIERQLDRDRAEIGNIIEAIQHRLSPGQLLDQAMGYARSGGSHAVSAVGRSASQNPWPLILTGVGLAWLIQSTSASRNGDRSGNGVYKYHPDVSQDAARRDAIARARSAAAAIQRQAHESESTFQERVTEAKAKAMDLKRRSEETAEGFRQRVESYMHRAEEAASELRHRATSAMSRGADSVGETARAMQGRAQDVQSRARDLYTSDPLIVGALSVAVGTLLGALIPTTQAENRLIGEYGGQLRRKAADVASDAAERSRTAAAEGVKAAAHAAEEAAGVGGDAEDRSVKEAAQHV
jgi:ElaB/YqjD/DUF883 family membrane-anchored ribosome-binding protein